MEEQARLSHLAFDSDSKPPQWSTDGWPRLLGGWRQAHASIVIGEGNTESIVVLGGWTENDVNDSVLVMNTTEKLFRQGPSMSERRCYFAARKVNIGVYACGGLNKSSKACGGSRKSKKHLDTIERIDVNELLETPADATTGKWKTLPCRLTAPRGYCTACDVMNRYLVIVGGYNGRAFLSSVDILDTGGDGNNHTIVAGIDMNVARYCATSEVIGTRMFVVGGTGNQGQLLRSVEYVEFGCHDNSGNACSVFQTNSCWTLDNDLALSPGRGRSAMAKIGKCLVVADGSSSSAAVEVLDTDRRVVWSLPSMTVQRRGCSMVALSKSIVVIGGLHADSLESLSIHLSQREQLKAIYNNRAELEAELDKLTTAIHRASVETTSVQILQEGAEAEDLIPILKSLRSDDKFRTADDIQEQIDELTMELDRVHSAKERIPTVKQINKLKELLTESCGKISDNSMLSAQHSAPLANLALVPTTDSFYAKLVEANDDLMIGKVHELSALVFHAHHVKVFYTLVNHLFRLGIISLEHRRHYTSKALKVITTNAPEQEREIFSTILEKAVEDGALSESDSEEIKRNNNTVGSTQQPSHRTDIRSHLVAMQFRIGNVRGPPIDTIKPPLSSNVDDKNHKKNNILSEVQVLGWSLNQLQKASWKGRQEDIAIAAIFSVLNACRFGVNVQDGSQKQNRTDMSIAPTPIILPWLVDFGDIHHIGQVVEQSGVLSAQRAFAEGIALVDGAIAAAKHNEMMASAATNLEQNLKTGSLSSSDILVAVMGKFANAVSQWYKKYDGNCGSNEEVTILALAVTAKLVQASESKVITPSVSNFDSSAVDLSLKSEYQKGKDCSLFHGTGQASAAKLCDSTSNIVVPAPAVSNQHPKSILARVERLESTMGNCVSLVQRISALEGNCGLDGTGMTLADRLSKLEDRLFKDP